MKQFTMNATALLLLTVLGLFFSCSDDDNHPINEVTRMIMEVRRATKIYKNHDKALAAGWDTDLSGCVSHPTEGGMGHHFGRLALIDGELNHLEPEVLLYLPDDKGRMELLGVEYLVPFAIHPVDTAPPMLFGQHFHQNPMIEMWTLHVWTEKENPKGIFYDWNPEVECPSTN